jgi:hypothetical protein
MNEHYWGIKGWKPFWYESTNEFIASLETEKICGSVIKSTWTLWDGDEWFEDAPIVIFAGEKQLEFCANKIGAFSISVNTIDIREPVSWCEEPNGFGSLRWKKDAHPLLAKLLGKNIIETGAIEYCLDENIQELFNQDWVLSGVYLSCESAYVEIFNALDTNGITNDRNSIPRLRYVNCKA